MQYTLSDCLNAINQNLNYPSLSYEDISTYFDQAIAELNTELHLGLKPISHIYTETRTTDNYSPCIMLSSPPVLNTAIPGIVEGHTPDVYYHDGLIHYKNPNTTEYLTTKILYGVYADAAKAPDKEIYHTVVLGGYAYWTPYVKYVEHDINLLDYMPYDWIILYLIPYVCFKQALRDGGSGVQFSDDFTQGFQQLRNAYNIPCSVELYKYADKKAYKEDVLNRLPNLNTLVPTRAIYESMKVDRVINAEYGGFYDKGGWGF